MLQTAKLRLTDIRTSQLSISELCFALIPRACSCSSHVRTVVGTARKYALSCPYGLYYSFL